MARSCLALNPSKKVRVELADAVTPRENSGAPIHNWFVFRHAFSPRLVAAVLEKLGLCAGACVLDPFCGSGTTLLACKEQNVDALGLDVLPLSVFVTNVKVRAYNDETLRRTLDFICTQDVRPGGTWPRIPVVQKSFTPAVKRKFLDLRDRIDRVKHETEREFFRLAMLRIVEDFAKAAKDGAFLRLVPAKRVWPSKIFPRFTETARQMIRDVESRSHGALPNEGRWKAYLGDARAMSEDLGICDAILTSPPYLNRHDYTRIYSLELALGFVNCQEELKHLRYSSLSSHVESRTSLHEKSFDPPRLLRQVRRELVLSESIEPKVLRMFDGYFLDLWRFLRSAVKVLKPGGDMVLVLGNVRFAGICIPVDKIVVQLGECLGISCTDMWAARLRGNSPQQMRKYGRVASSENIIFLRSNKSRKGD